MAVSGLQFGRGTALWAYWTRGDGLAKWSGSPTPWTTLVALLSQYVNPETAKGLASEMFEAVFHQTPYQHAHG